MSAIAATSFGVLFVLTGQLLPQSFTPAKMVQTSGSLATTSFWKRFFIWTAVWPLMPTPYHVTSMPFAARPWTTRRR